MHFSHILAAFVLICYCTPALAAGPVVSDLIVSQRSGTKFVDIFYGVTAATPTVDVTLEISNDGGLTYLVPANSATGAVGNKVPTGTGKKIVWNAGADWNGRFTPQMRFRVLADDGLISPTITTQPTSSTINAGGTVALSVVASGTEPLTYQWYQGSVGATNIPVGTNSASFTTPALVATTPYWVRVSNAAGTVDSALSTVSVVISPTITTQPTSPTISAGGTVSLSVVASGTEPLTYQWYQGSVGATNIPVGTNSASFTTPALVATTPYWVRVSNAAGTVDSVQATVAIAAAPESFAGFSLIPAGSFTMGDSLDGYGDAPPVGVIVSEFHIGRYEVTKALWDQVRTWGLDHGYLDLLPGIAKNPEHPVQQITWWDALKWCNALSEMNDLTPVYTESGAVMKIGTSDPEVNWSANGYRLPTEAEWEKAARGGLVGKRFPWGDQISHDDANFWNGGGESYQSGTTGYHPLYYINTQPSASPVGSFAPNGFGLYDTAGNVSEWCWDLFASQIYAGGAIDPKGGDSGSNRVIRGGGWSGGDAEDCRVAMRGYYVSTNAADTIGFRLVRSIAP